MNLSRINKIQGLQGRDYEIEYLRLLTGKDLQDVLLTFEDNNPSSSLYEEILLADFQAASAAGTLTAGKTYAITDLLTGIGTFRLLLQGFNRATSNGVQNGTLIYTNFINNSFGIWDVQFNINGGNFILFYNRALDIRCTSESMFQALFTGNLAGALFNDKIISCDFSNYTGTLTLDGGNNTTLKNCDFSNSSANFITTNLTLAATFSGRILYNFVIPDQTSYPCDFTIPIFINADGTNNMVATVTLGVGSNLLNFADYESASTVILIPDAGSNTIDTIINAAVGREYIIRSNDVSANLNIATGVNIFIAESINLLYAGLITWGASGSGFNKVYFTYDGTNALINNKTSTYA